MNPIGCQQLCRCEVTYPTPPTLLVILPSLFTAVVPQCHRNICHLLLLLLPWFTAALTQKVFASERVASQQTHFPVRLWGETYGGGGASGESQQTSSSSSLVSECFRISLTSRSSLILHPASRRMEPDGITTIEFTAEVASTQQQRQQSRLMRFSLPFRRRWLTRPRDLQPPDNNRNRWKCIKTSFHSSFVPLTAASFKKKRGSPPARLAQRQEKPAGDGRGKRQTKKNMLSCVFAAGCPPPAPPLLPRDHVSAAAPFTQTQSSSWMKSFEAEIMRVRPFGCCSNYSTLAKSLVRICRIFFLYRHVQSVQSHETLVARSFVGRFFFSGLLVFKAANRTNILKNLRRRRWRRKVEPSVDFTFSVFLVCLFSAQVGN